MVASVMGGSKGIKPFFAGVSLKVTTGAVSAQFPAEMVPETVMLVPGATALAGRNAIFEIPLVNRERSFVSKAAEDIRADLTVAGAAACHREYLAVIELAAVVGMRLKAVVFIGRVAADLQGMGHDVYSST